VNQARVRENCGLFGVYGQRDAAELTYLALFAQQHRGQESAGICTSDGGQIVRYAGLGLVAEVLDRRHLEQLRNPIAIGHVRYSTTGSPSVQNSQPLLVEYARGQVAVCHNGNLINAGLLRRRYEEQGRIFQTTSDTEVIIHLLADPEHMDLADPLGHVLTHLQGAFSLLVLFPDRIEAARDAYGIRPLCIGRMADGSYCVASETIALAVVDASYVRDVEPGEIVTLSKEGIRSRYFVDPKQYRPAHCIFELVYFADPSSNVFEQNVHLARVAMGRQLAREAPAAADLVVAVPNCARCAAIGYSRESGIPFGRGFTTSHYVGRSFIMPNQAMRNLVVRMKLNVIQEAVQGKRLVVIEDSIVRGTTTRGKLGALRRAGAKEIHVRVASPPIRNPCYYGIDFPTSEELVASRLGRVEAIRDYLEVNSLGYLSLEGMLSCVAGPTGHYCTACFSGEYPIPIDHQVHKFALERYQLRMFQ
jgi:amidophosphoribosyltransferase